MRRSVWLAVGPVVGLLATVAALTSPAQAAAPPASACAGPASLGWNMTAGLCMDSFNLSGNTYGAASPAHVDFSATKARYYNCYVHVVIRNTAHQNDESTRKADCRKAANHHEDFVLSGTDPIIGCSQGDIIQGRMYVTFTYLSDALNGTHHTTKGLSLAVTCQG